MTTNPLLFQPIELREVRAKNRIVISPMCQYSASDGFVTDWHTVHLGKLAQGGAGIVFIEATAVEARGRITHGDVGIWDDAHVPGLRAVADLIRSQGAIPAVQLAHAGRKGSMQRPWFGNGPLTQADFDRGDLAWPTIAPSAIPTGEGWQVPSTITGADIARLRVAYTNAVRRADEAGFEIAEVHGAHGYLLHSFLSPISNHRSDAYGGDRNGRMRLPLEIAALVREAWPANKPLFYRISSVDEVEPGWALDDSVALAKGLKALGIDIIDCSSGGIVGAATAAVKAPPGGRGPGFQIPYAERIKREVGVRTMAVGLILTGPQAEQTLAAGRADLIAIGREAMFDPNWPLKAALDLGVDPGFDQWQHQYGWWLTRRESVLRKQGIHHRAAIRLAGEPEGQ